MPLGNGYWANLLENDAYDSFSEIFIQQEYADYLPKEPISRILDIGAHYGYFSLWLQSKNPEIEIHSLMVEPSSRSRRSLNRLIEHQKLNGRFTYLQKIIDVPEKGTAIFYERRHMASSKFSYNGEEIGTNVQTLSENDILECLHPPYDLVIIDIEGSEWHFLKNYIETLKHTKHLVMEWHSWHEGGGSLTTILQELSALGFQVNKKSPAIPANGREGEVGLISATRRNEGR